jgi:hypothetical protein
MHDFIITYFPMLPRTYQHEQQLNGTEPAMVQLSRMCLIATCSQYFGRDMHRLRGIIKAYGEDGAADYIWSHYAYAMAHFLEYKVRQHDYNRSVSFWCNVLSSVYSVHNYVDSRYKRRYGCGLSSLNDMLGGEDGTVEWMSTLTYKDRQLPMSYRSKRKTDDEEMTRLEDREILGLCDTYCNG